MRARAQQPRADAVAPVLAKSLKILHYPAEVPSRPPHPAKTASRLLTTFSASRPVSSWRWSKRHS